MAGISGRALAFTNIENKYRFNNATELTAILTLTYMKLRLEVWILN
jgi:hypothetical protein